LEFHPSRICYCRCAFCVCQSHVSHSARTICALNSAGTCLLVGSMVASGVDTAMETWWSRCCSVVTLKFGKNQVSMLIFCYINRARSENQPQTENESMQQAMVTDKENSNQHCLLHLIGGVKAKRGTFVQLWEF
jgi:hypothetical protein